MDKKDFKLENISIRFCDRGEDKGSYNGTIEFQNGQYESFKFRIEKETAGKYIKLIAEEVVKSCEKLSTDLLGSLKKQNLI